MWWIFTIVVTGMITYLFFAPLIIDINSIKDLYRIRFHRLAGIRVILNEGVQLEVNICGWKKIYNPLNSTEKTPVKTKEDSKPANNRKGKGIPARVIMHKLKGLMRSFKITQCYISVDTGDMPLNGILYPWVYLLSRRTGRQITINFQDENIVILRIENNLARMLWAYIKS